MYLASLLFTDDEKLLVTVDENIPIIEVDDNHPSTFLQDFCWLMKVQTLRKQTAISCCPFGLLFCPMLVTWCLAFSPSHLCIPTHNAFNIPSFCHIWNARKFTGKTSLVVNWLFYVKTNASRMSRTLFPSLTESLLPLPQSLYGRTVIIKFSYINRFPIFISILAPLLIFSTTLITGICKFLQKNWSIFSSCFVWIFWCQLQQGT